MAGLPSYRWRSGLGLGCRFAHADPCQQHGDEGASNPRYQSLPIGRRTRTPSPCMVAYDAGLSPIAHRFRCGHQKGGLNFLSVSMDSASMPFLMRGYPPTRSPARQGGGDAVIHFPQYFNCWWHTGLIFFNGRSSLPARWRYQHLCTMFSTSLVLVLRMQM